VSGTRMLTAAGERASEQRSHPARRDCSDAVAAGAARPATMSVRSWQHLSAVRASSCNERNLALLMSGVSACGCCCCCRYLRLITPTLYMNAVVECLKRYLLAQRVVVPGMVVTVLTCLLSPLYNWLLIFRCGRCLLVGSDSTLLCACVPQSNRACQNKP
jgi:hypothetical protein